MFACPDCGRENQQARDRFRADVAAGKYDERGYARTRKKAQDEHTS
jgi:hypothetical protein